MALASDANLMTEGGQRTNTTNKYGTLYTIEVVLDRILFYSRPENRSAKVRDSLNDEF